MEINHNKSVSLAYQLKVDGEIIETVGKEQPMKFVFGTGYLLPKFEEHLLGKKAGDSFAFDLSAEDAYGEVIEDAFVELNKEIFKVDDVIDESLFVIGNVIPMADSQGNPLNGTVDKINEETVVLNFNHPLAGNNLSFTGEIVDVHELTQEEIDAMGGESSCGCSCNSCDSGC